MEDNQPVIDLTKDLSARSKKCKHFLMLVHYIKEQVEAGIVLLSKVDTSQNTADVLTKIITGNEYRFKSLLLLGHSNDQHLANDCQSPDHSERYYSNRP
jgi:hypothetical protein